MLTYSIAIRTLGTSGEMFREELLSIAAQSVQPERVVVYIADGYERPGFTVGREEYVWVTKGMVAQRIRPYDEIASDVIFMLDDDVRLAPDSAERMLRAMEEYGADCVGADTFKNHEMTFAAKIYAAANLVFPHAAGSRWAFRIRRNGLFSYNRKPSRDFYWSQSCSGNAVMWRRSVYGLLHLEDEMWLDELPFAYGDDMVETYKVYRNGFKLGVVYDSGCEHLDCGTSSREFRRGAQWMHTRAMASLVAWWRTIYRPAGAASAAGCLAALSFGARCAWMFAAVCAVAAVKAEARLIGSYLRGLRDGWRFVHAEKFKSLRNYICTE